MYICVWVHGGSLVPGPPQFLPSICIYRSVPQIPPPFATLALVQNAGGAYARGGGVFAGHYSTLIHESGRLVKNGEGLEAFMT